MIDAPAKRCSLTELSQTLNAPDSQAASGAKPQTVAMAARYWSEGDLVAFGDRQFRIASRIGSGSFGSTFKIIEVHEGQDVGIYAGKVMFDAESGKRALNAYRRASSHTVQPHLATVHHFASEWEDDRFIALLQWVEGRTLYDWIGYAELYAEELKETPVAVVSRWISSCCEGLSSLHRAGLVHGDVSPKNIIEHAGDVSLVDFDLLLPQGDASWSGGTVMYTPSQHAIGNPASCSHDIYALASTMYHVVFDRQPFWYGGEKHQEKGLDWSELDRDAWQWIPKGSRRTRSSRPVSLFR